MTSIRKLRISQWWVVLLALFLLVGNACREHRGTVMQPRPSATAGPIRTSGHANIGFASHRQLAEHYEKHGREFGSISQIEYLRQAQALRDRPMNLAGNEVLEAARDDGVVTRYDRRTGAFLAFDQDLTIRTFFKPNDGERYFQRQRRR